MIRSLLAAALAFACLAPAARAHRHDNHHRPTIATCVETGNDLMHPRCGMDQPLQTSPRLLVRVHHHEFRRGRAASAGEIVAHPRGCPSRLFCGCGAAVKVFGEPIRNLWPAISWLHKFPRTAPAPGMVAVRRHHVFVLEAPIAGPIWRVYDANSGGHLTRIHARSIAGYVIVDPHRRRTRFE